jgi:hypothetical protein
MAKITLANIRDAVNRAIRLKGADYVYVGDDLKRCTYLNSADQPSCLIGYALIDLGVSWDTLLNHNRNSISTLSIRGVVDIEEDALTWAANVQVLQDRGETWGVAVAGANDCLEGKISYVRGR